MFFYKDCYPQQMDLNQFLNQFHHNSWNKSTNQEIEKKFGIWQFSKFEHFLWYATMIFYIGNWFPLYHQLFIIRNDNFLIFRCTYIIIKNRSIWNRVDQVLCLRFHILLFLIMMYVMVPELLRSVVAFVSVLIM